jgi:rhodanese-related sulfurtransferase
MKKILILCLAITVTGISVGNALNHPGDQKNINKESFQTLSVDSFEAKINSLADVQIIDTRLPEEYAINHLINAININAQQKDYADLVNKLDRTKPVFAYAIGNARSELLAKELISKGFTQVYVLDGGIGGWIGNGKPIYSSSKDNFSLNDFNKITSTNKLVLLDLHTRYCPGCRKLQPTVDSLATAYSGSLKVVKVDVYDNPKIAGNFKINAIPTLIVYDNGKIIWQRTGADTHKNDVDAVLANVK